MTTANSADDEATVGRLLWARMPRAGTIMIGPGRPGSLLAGAIAADPAGADDLTVFTNSLQVAVTLAPVRQVKVYTLGGVVSPRNSAQEGAWPIEQLRRLRVDVCLITPDGIDPLAGLTCDSPAAAAVAQEQVGCADRVLALADPNTLGRISFTRFAPVTALSEIVVPDGLDSSALGVLDRLRELRIRLVERDRH